MAAPLDYASSPAPRVQARKALALLLAINLFNYIDRMVLAAVEPEIQNQFFPNNAPNAEFYMGLLATAFIISYMVSAPILGLLADRFNRWHIVGISVLIWSLATGGSGVAAWLGGFILLMMTRVFVGIGEAGYGPAAPTLISDLYPVARRGAVLSWFYMAIPVGSALGYVVGMLIGQHFHWSNAFFAVVIPGILLGIMALMQPDPPRGQADPGGADHASRKARLADYMILLRTPSYVLDSLGMAAMTFAIGGISYWMPRYLVEVRHAGTKGQVGLMFGGITVVAGLVSTLAGGLTGDFVRKYDRSSYFLVSGIGILIACPFILMMRHAEFPLAWVYIFIAEFFLFFNTGPSNTILANVTHPAMRATGFAMNILVIHLLGDAISPPILGAIAHTEDGSSRGWDHAFELVAAMMALAGLLWLIGCQFLARDTEAAPGLLDNSGEA